MTTEIKDIEFYGLLITYNPYTKLWHSGTSEAISKHLNGDSSETITAKSIKELETKIRKSK